MYVTLFFSKLLSLNFTCYKWGEILKAAQLIHHQNAKVSSEFQENKYYSNYYPGNLISVQYS